MVNDELTFNLLGNTLVYTCTDQQTCQQLVKVPNKHRIKRETLFRVNDARDLPKPVKMAFKILDMINPKKSS